MVNGWAALAWGILTFSLLILIHEGGHFIAARLFGVHVHEFMIGLPGPALRIHGKKTTYGITAVPLGGYVRIAGMEPGPEDPLIKNALEVATRAGQIDAPHLAEALGIEYEQAESLLVTLADWGALADADAADGTYRSLHDADEAENPGKLYKDARAITYRALPLAKRVALLCAGVLFNLVTAVVVFTVVLTIWGYDKETTTVRVVDQGSAAALSGMIVGDRIVSIDGRPTAEWTDLVVELRTHMVGEKVDVTVSRYGKTMHLTAVLGAKPGTNKPMLGVRPVFHRVHLTPVQALTQSFGYIGLTFKAITGFFDPRRFTESISQSSSVIGASYIAAEAAKSGPIDYAYIVALLSLSLGVINIFPIPPLDGGKIVLEVFERVRGKQISRNVSIGLSVSGATLLFALVGYLMYADIVRFIVSS